MPNAEALAGDLMAVATHVLGQAEPGEDLEVVVAQSSTTNVRAYAGQVEALTVANVAGVGVRVVAGGRQGFASAGSLAAEVLSEVVAEARDNMAFAAADEAIALVEPDGTAAAELDLWDNGVAERSIDDKVSAAIDLERAVLAADSRVTGVRTATYADRRGASVLASTTGMQAASASTMASLAAQALARDGDETKSGYGSSVARGPASLDPAEVVDKAVERATNLLGAVQPASERLTLVFEPRLAATLLGIIGSMLSGERVLKGRTPFADRVGEEIASPLLTMTDDPTNADSFGASSFDGEGLATRPNMLIADGVLQGYMYDSVSATRAGVASTANAVRGVRSTPSVGWHALSISPGEGTLESIVAGVENGLLIQSMAGLHSGVNAVSGDFSVGAEGLRIRGGKLAEPVCEVTVASTLPRLLTDVSAVGLDVEHSPGGISTPTISVANVAMSGK